MTQNLDFLIINDLKIRKEGKERFFEIIFSDEHSLIGVQGPVGASRTKEALKEMSSLEAQYFGIPLRLDRGAVLLPENIRFDFIDAVFSPRDANGRTLGLLRRYYLEESQASILAAPMRPHRAVIDKLEEIRVAESIMEKKYSRGDFEYCCLAIKEESRFYASRKTNLDSSFEVTARIGEINKEKKTLTLLGVYLSIDFYCSGYSPELEIPLQWLTNIFPAADLFELLKCMKN